MASLANKFASAATNNALKKALESKTGSSAAQAAASVAAAAGTQKNTSTAQNKTPSGGYTQKYTGGNTELDAGLAKYSQAYQEARAKGDPVGMREANDLANQLRNQYGYAAEFANDDIEYIKEQTGYYQNNPTVSSQQSTAQMGAPQADYSNYLEEMYAAQKRNALAQLEAAYDKNVSALDRAEQEISPGYRSARNQAAANSALSGRNFAEYASAAGLNSGAMGQAELARNVALQNSLNDLNTQEASSLADLELHRSQAKTDYNAAVAQAKASGDYELAAALYEEAVRQSESALQQQMLDYQKERDAVADQQWQNQFDYKKEQTAAQTAAAQTAQLAEYGTAFLNNGVMPSQEMLSAMGITAADAQSYIDRLKLAASLAAAGGGGNDKEAEPEWGSGYSTALNQNGMKSSEWAMVRNNIASNLRAGNFQNVSTYLDQVSGGMSKEQWNEIAALLSQYGYSGVQTY